MGSWDDSKKVHECSAVAWTSFRDGTRPLVHLPVQSGSNKVLELMNRKHTIQEYLDIYDRLKKINPAIEFSSDFIIAYPGEDEQDFNETFSLIKKIWVEFLKVFKFSKVVNLAV